MFRVYQMLIVFCVLAGSLATASAIVERNIPVSMNMDGNEMLSSLYITCNAEPIPISDFTKFKDDEPTKRDLKKMFSKIKDGKLSEAAEFGNKWKNKSLDDKRAKRLTNHLKGYSMLFGKYTKQGKGIGIYDNLLIGNGGMIVFGCDGKPESANPFTQRRSVFYEKTAENKTQWSVAELYNPFQSLVTESYQALADDPNLINTIPEKGKCTYKIPIEGLGTENIVYLEFNGKLYNGIDIINDEITINDEVLNFYQYVNKLWLDFPPEELAKYYTPLVRDWILGLTLDDAKKFRSRLRPGIKVFFIMEAKPFYVVFYKVGRYKVLYSDFLYIDPNDSQLKFTNLKSIDTQRQYFISDQFKHVLNTIDGNLFPLK